MVRGARLHFGVPAILITVSAVATPVIWLTTIYYSKSPISYQLGKVSITISCVRKLRSSVSLHLVGAFVAPHVLVE